MRYLSLFSGVEAASLAWESLGWEPAAFCEFDEFPSAVLAHHWPNVPNFGDVTQIKEKDIKSLGRIDVIVFGSPCQDLSIAGKREGFNGERSSLFRDAIKIVKWARKHCGARFALWENVPGAFTSNKGADFCEVLSSLSGSKQPQPERWGGAGVCFGKSALVEWATLDAQFIGVPQRRRRVFALADFGDWSGRKPIFSIAKGMCWNYSPCRTPKQNTSKTARKGTSKSHWDEPGSPHPTLNQSNNKTGSPGYSDQELFSQGGAGLVPFDMRGFGDYGDGKVASTCKARDWKDATDLVTKQWPAEITTTVDTAFATKLGLENQHIDSGATLFVPAVHPIQDQATRYAGNGGIGKGNGLGIGEEGDPSFTLTTGDKHAICTTKPRNNEILGGQHPNAAALDDGTCPTLTAAMGMGGGHIPIVHGTQDPDVSDGIAHPVGRNYGQESVFPSSPKAYAFDSEASNSMKSSNPNSGCREVDVSKTIDTTRPCPSKNQGGIAIVDSELTLGSDEDDSVVRRLTPKECERLQGMPDGHTMIPWKGKPAELCPDGPRYKAIGNSMAVPVMRFIAERIQQEANAT